MTGCVTLDEKFEEKRLEMVYTQIEQRGLTEARLLQALRSVPRHRFVPLDVQEHAYDDGPLPIGSGQTISQPYIVALMTSLAALQGDENVLEIGTGSGYQAAVLVCLAKTVHTIERHPALAGWAGSTLEDLGYKNVTVHLGDGSLGWPEAAPYQAIIVTAAAPRPPQPLLDQLTEGGRLIIPVGERRQQDLQVWQREGGQFTWETIIPVAFVPMRGEHGWKEDQWPETPVQYY
jgi:protein-L-isoaspartate(D-aspartate) O-methyltransferase